MNSLSCSHPDGCKKPQDSGGKFCAMHRKRVQRTGELGPVGLIQPFSVCQKEGCENPYKADGLCSLHWDQRDRKSELKKLTRNRVGFKRLGWTPEEVLIMRIAQNSKCAKCGLSNYERGLNRELAADHDHETGMRRGLLCHNCNTAIGMLGDNIEGLKEALRYLQFSG